MSSLTGHTSGHLVARTLEEYGVSHVFGIPGPQLLPLYNAIDDSNGALRHVLVRDERSAAYAADAFARISGRLAACDAMSGPGFVKFASGLAEAQASSTPLIALAGDAPRDERHLAAYGTASQVLPDQAELLRPLTKASIRVESQRGLAGGLHRAFATATSGRPGPVLLSIPMDVMLQEWDEDHLPLRAQRKHGTFPSARVRPDHDSVVAAAKVLTDAERPVVIVGGGGLHSAAAEELHALAEESQAPVATTVTGKGVFDEAHPLSAGVFGSQYGEDFTATLVAEADVVFLVGFKSAERSTERWTVPRADQRVIHLDVDPAEIGKVFATEVGLVGDAALGLADVHAELRAQTRPQPRRPEWLARLAQLRGEWRASIDAEAVHQQPILPQQIARDLNGLLGDEEIVVSDASLSAGWVAGFTHIRKTGRRYLFTRGTGGLGFGLPASIGAAMASPGSKVVCVAGDGGFAYSLAELSTCVKYELPIVSIVLNNSAFGYSAWMERVGRGNYDNTDFPPTDFAAIARGFGATGIRVEDPSEVQGALSDALKEDGPVVLDMVTDRWAVSDITLRRALASGALQV